MLETYLHLLADPNANYGLTKNLSGSMVRAQVHKKVMQQDARTGDLSCHLGSNPPGPISLTFVTFSNPAKHGTMHLVEGLYKWIEGYSITGKGVAGGSGFRV